MRFLLRLAALLPPLLAAVPASAEELPAFEITARGGKLLPARLEVPTGRRIKLVFRNEGPGPEEFESTSPRFEKVLAAGASSFVVLPPLAAGSYRIFGEFHPGTAEAALVAK